MGLNIRAFKKLKKVDSPKFDKYGELLNWETHQKRSDG